MGFYKRAFCRDVGFDLVNDVWECANRLRIHIDVRIDDEIPRKVRAMNVRGKLSGPGVVDLYNAEAPPLEAVGDALIQAALLQRFPFLANVFTYLPCQRVCQTFVE